MIKFIYLLGQRGMHSKANVYRYIYNCAQQNIGKQKWEIKKRKINQCKEFTKKGRGS